jgi:hypothetical protein
MTTPNIPSAEIEPPKLPEPTMLWHHEDAAGTAVASPEPMFDAEKLLSFGNRRFVEGYAKGRQSAALDALVADGQAVERAALSEDDLKRLDYEAFKSLGVTLKEFDTDGRQWDQKVAFARAIEAELRARSMEAETRNAALEDAAKICESIRDLTEAKRANKAAAEALDRGDEADALHRLRHQSNVSLFNGALERAAREIRALSSAPSMTAEVGL